MANLAASGSATSAQKRKGQKPGRCQTIGIRRDTRNAQLQSCLPQPSAFQAGVFSYYENPTLGVGFSRVSAANRKKLLLRAWRYGLTTSKRPYLRNPPDTRVPALQMTIFGKDDAPFQGGKEEKCPSWTGGKQQTCAEARPPMRLRGRCWHSRALPAHATSRLRRGIIIALFAAILLPRKDGNSAKRRLPNRCRMVYSIFHAKPC